MRRRDFIRAIVGSGTKAGIIFCLLALFACQVALATEPKRVLMLYSFGRDFTPWKEYASTIRSELERQSPWPLNIEDQSLVSARSSNEDPEVPFIDYLRALYSKNPPDLIVGIGAPAAVFVQRHRQQIFPKAPMVFTAMEQRRIDVSALTEHDSVVAMTHDFAAAIENILRVLPDTKNVMVVNGYSPNERFWLEEIRREVRPLESRVAFTWTSHLSFEEILKLASELPLHSAILWHTMYVDGAGVAHEDDSALKRLHAIAKAPIFSLFDVFLTGETVGGPMHSMLEEAQDTAAVAIRILNGEKPGDIKVPPTRFATPKYDWREMQRWGISEKNLPPGSEILFRPPTAWEQYKMPISAITAAILAQALLIAWLIHERQYRRRVERTARETFSELTQMNRMATAGELSAAIAHEIRQPITGMVTMANAALRWLSRENPDIGRAQDAMNKVVAAGHQASDVITNVRGLFAKDTQEKVPTDINKLVKTVLGLVYMDLRKHSIETNVNLSEQLPTIFGNEVQLQQVILNLVMNAIESMNSAEPRILSIKTEMVGQNAVHVSVADTGSGISVANLNRIFKPMFTTKAHGMGMGLSICKSIIESHGGKIWVSAGASRGSIFQFELPVYQSGERKSDWSDRTSATLSGSPPLVADDEVIE
jgi:signal transduction histidine kinase